MVNALCNAGAFSVRPELRTRWVAFEETSCCLLPPDCVTTLACRWAFVTSRHRNPATRYWNYTLNPRNYSLFDHPRVGPRPHAMTPGGPPGLSVGFFQPLVSLVLPDLAVMLSVSVSIRTIEH